MSHQLTKALRICLYLCAIVLPVCTHATIVDPPDECDSGRSGSWACHSMFDGPRSLETSANTDWSTGNASLVRIPSKMDNLYRYNVNSDSDIVTYYNPARKTLQQALTFYNSDRHLSITVRDFPSGQWSTPEDIHRHIGNDELEYDSHNSTGFGIAPDGTMLVTANQHVDPLRMAMTTRPYDITSFQRLPVDAINGNDNDRVTYPSFAYLDAELFFSYREQEAGGGHPAYRWLLKKWNSSARRWDDAAQFNTGKDLRLYVSNITWNIAGTELHLSACWRDDRREKLSSGTDQQHDLFHLYSRDGKRWQQYSTGSVELPFLWSGPNKSNVPELIWNTGAGDPVPANAGSIAVDADSYPHILNRADNGELFYHFHDGKRWHSIQNVFTSKSEDIFQLPDGMGAVSARGDELYFHRLTPDIDRLGVLLAKGYITRDFNASVDKRAIDHGWLSMMLTENTHYGVNQKNGVHPTDAFVLSIPLADLNTFDEPFRR